MTSSHSTPADPGFLAGEILQQNYHIKALIGEGGMAYVYRATHRVLGGDVAVKVLQRRYAQRDDFRERFLREARLQYQLSHPNIVRVLDFIEDRGLVGCVQEYCDGGELTPPSLSPDGQLPLGLLKERFFPLLDALGDVHDKGIIHRDIKPQNILLQRQQDQQDRILWKLSDFGLLKDPNAEQLTQSGAVIGTFHYISPEQYQESREVDRRTDIYSLGVVLYKLLLGRVPFPAKMPRLALQIIEAPVPFPASFPAPLRRVLERTLAKVPEQRYASCQELKAALDDAFALCQHQTYKAPETLAERTEHLPNEVPVIRAHPPGGEPILPASSAPPKPAVEAALLASGVGDARRVENEPALSSQDATPLPPSSVSRPAASSQRRGFFFFIGLLALGGLGVFGWKRLQRPPQAPMNASLLTKRFARDTAQQLREIHPRQLIKYGANFARRDNWGSTRYYLRRNCKTYGILCGAYARWVYDTLDIWRRGCKAGDTSSCDWLRKTKQRGWRRSRFQKRAMPLYQRACERSEAWACFWLGAHRARGGAPWRPTAQERRWLRRGCQLKHARSCLLLGQWYRFQPGRQGQHLASSWLEKACTYADVSGCLLWGQLILKQQEPLTAAQQKQAHHAFGQACKLHSRLGCRLRKQQ